jgi:hypothetical protein
MTMQKLSAVAPPVNTWIFGSYTDDDHAQILLTCKKGCCVHSSIGCMVLPTYWRLATPEEVQVEELLRSQIDPISLGDLYE